MLNPGRDLLSHLVFVTKYAGTNPDGTRETQAHAVERVCDMHRKKVARNNKITDANKAILYKEIDECERLLKDRVISPSMRSFQFAGRGIERSHARGYNCAYAPLDDHRAFGELMFLLMNGCGVGFSCERSAIAAIPPVYPGSPVLFQVADTKEAWADSIIALMENPDTIFDYTKVRPEGAPLSTGGTASGPGPLRKAHNAIKAILRGRLHQRLRPIDVFDIACHVAAAVHCGGVRRSAMIAIFDKDDEEMLTAKSGDWDLTNPQRSQANISARLLPGESPTPLMLRMFENQTGEPGFFRAPNTTCGTNPCVPAGTMVLTHNGYRAIETLVGKQVEAWNGFEWSAVTPAITGQDQPLVEVTLSSGQSLTCTEYHEFVLKDGTRVKAKDLAPGMPLIKTHMPTVDGGKSSAGEFDAYTQGFWQGDCTSGSRDISLYAPKYECKPRLVFEYMNGPTPSNMERVHLKKCAVVPHKAFIPIDYDMPTRLNWLAGMLDSDGCLLKDGQLQICSIDKGFLLGIQKMLTTMGCTSKVTIAAEPRIYTWKHDGRTYPCKASWRLLINAVQVQHLRQLGLRCERIAFGDRIPNRDASRFVTVVEVAPAGVADVVYCFTEPLRHMGCFEGIVTGQCGEIMLQPRQFCNLTSVNMAAFDFTSDADWQAAKNAVDSAAVLGTLQASYTDFTYLRPAWKRVTEEEALLGVSLNGLADCNVTPQQLRTLAFIAVDANRHASKLLGINPAARVTTVKPEGTNSLYLGCSPGIHSGGAYGTHYWRRMTFGKSEPITAVLRDAFKHAPWEAVEQNNYGGQEDKVFLKVPVIAPAGKKETAIEFLERVKVVQQNWVVPGSEGSELTNNVSATCTYTEEESYDVMIWVAKNQNEIGSLSFLPSDTHTYAQPIYEPRDPDATAAADIWLAQNIDAIHAAIDAAKLGDVDLQAEMACAGGACEVK